jgi:hypothetical protein
MATLASTSAAPRCRPSRVPGGAGAEGHRVRADPCQVHLCQGTPPGFLDSRTDACIHANKHARTPARELARAHTRIHTTKHTGDWHEAWALLSRAVAGRSSQRGTRVCPRLHLKHPVCPQFTQARSGVTPAKKTAAAEEDV